VSGMQGSFRYLPLDVAQVPPDGEIRHLSDRWWAVDPERGLIFYVPPGSRSGSACPQCNDNEGFIRRLTGELYPHAEVRFIKHVFVRIDHEGGCIVPRVTK